jgi:2,3,4,5-tetrahydropyridine-2-carboxylate N-succinyltransferase
LNLRKWARPEGTCTQLTGTCTHARTLAMPHDRLQTVIETAWDQRETISPATRGETREAVETALDLLDGGKLRVAEKTGGTWVVHQWLK